jgi:hypothetical protein
MTFQCNYQLIIFLNIMEMDVWLKNDLCNDMNNIDMVIWVIVKWLEYEKLVGD